MSSSAKKSSGNPVSLLWLRRDLRLHDHAALARANAGKERVQPVFIFDSDVLARFSHKDDRRLSFIAETLCHLHAQLEDTHAGLLVFHGKAEALIPRICGALEAQTLFASEDYEPATRARDNAVEQALNVKTEFIRVKDHLILSPEEALKKDGTPFKVFTPFSKVWHARMRETGAAREEVTDRAFYADYAQSLKACQTLHPLDPGKGAGPMLEQVGYRLQSDHPDVRHAHKHLDSFIEARLAPYKKNRDYMGINGTSRLSAYLRFGLLSARECLRAAQGHAAGGGEGAETWINELAWRDFYAMILYHFPETPTQEFNPLYRNLAWSQDKAHFTRFTQGQTGFPLVDAAMRQLLQTGFMHNRARMIVASFMTKDLLLDWRLGEEHFAQYLMDCDLSSNVGGWQWAASVGTDAQPYFRVFNPLLQSQKFDPNGDYIRAFVPELAHLSARDIHMPPEARRPKSYPAPIVDHAQIRDKAIEIFRSARKAS